MLKHQINPKQLCAIYACWLRKEIQKERCNATRDGFWNVSMCLEPKAGGGFLPLSLAFSR